MPGLLNAKQNTDIQAGLTPPAGTPVDDGGGDGGGDQGQYDEFVQNGMKLLHDKGGLKKTVESIRGDGDPIEGIANLVANIVMRVQDSAEKGGTEISGDVLMQGGTELLEQAVELAEAAGIHEFSEEDLGKAHRQAMDLYMATRQQQGKLPPEKFAPELEALQAAEQDGTLEELIPGITEFGQQSPAAEPAAAKKPSRGLVR